MEFTHSLAPHWHWFWIVPFLVMILMCVLATLMCRGLRGWRCGGGHVGRGRMGCCGPGRLHPSERGVETPRDARLVQAGGREHE